MSFDISPWRFSFVAEDAIRFPAGKAGNVLRGALGDVLREEPEYSSLFAPKSSAFALPSGLGDPPRPFVFRAAHLDHSVVRPGEPFHFDVHIVGRCPVDPFASAFQKAACNGFGAQRGRARLESVRLLGDCSITLTFASESSGATAATVHFLTPTELKHQDTLAARPDFDVLFSRARDRISTLAALYGDGPLDIDFRGLGERAALVRMLDCRIRRVHTERRSSRTGQVHPIGGFVGAASYEGDLDEFLPFLRAAEWVGVGRQTVWGKGQIAVKAGSSSLS